MSKSCKELFIEHVVMHDIEIPDSRIEELVADYDTIPIAWRSSPIDCDEIRALLREVKMSRIARAIRRNY